MTLPPPRHQATLTELAKLGFTELGSTGELLEALPDDVVAHFAHAANADQALRLLGELRAHAPAELQPVLSTPDAADRLIRILGASLGIASSCFGTRGSSPRCSPR